MCCLYILGQFTCEGRGLSTEPVRKIMGAVADRFGIEKRSYLKPDYALDLTIFGALSIPISAMNQSCPKGIDSI